MITYLVAMLLCGSYSIAQEYKDAKIQLLDLPGIIEGAAKGKGRGKQVIGVARTADVVLMMLDASKAEVQKRLLTAELEAVGIRINSRPPNVSIKVKKGGGVTLNAMCDLTHIDVHLVRNILHLYKIHNADVLCREDITEDDFIGNKTYSVFDSHACHSAYCSTG